MSSSDAQDETTYTVSADVRFTRAAKRFFRRHPDLRGRFAEVITLIAHDPFAQSLRTHPLRGSLDGYYGISLTYRYRIVLTIQVTEHQVRLYDIGDHDEVYA